MYNVSAILIRMKSWWHDQMEVFFRVTGPLWGEFTGHRGNPLTKGQ